MIFELYPIFAPHFNGLAGYTYSHALDDNLSYNVAYVPVDSRGRIVSNSKC
jgi:hypothetical protein